MIIKNVLLYIRFSHVRLLNQEKKVDSLNTNYFSRTLNLHKIRRFILQVYEKVSDVQRDLKLKGFFLHKKRASTEQKA